ncbi:glycoside hydrolase superfamily [Mycena amicta]|nr:glycoside hydrolase superfamily [Mycena amicta]
MAAASRAPVSSAHPHALFTLLLSSVHADLTTGVPNAAPAGSEEWISPLADVKGTADWASAVARARKFVAQRTIEEKFNVTTGVDIFGRCVGNTGTIPRLNWPGLCMEDSPLGVRFADFASAFPAGWRLGITRGVAMGEEHRGKGINAALGPMTNMGRQAAAGRQWEGFGSDPFLAGVATAATVEGIQSVGVIATVKHLCVYNHVKHLCVYNQRTRTLPRRLGGIPHLLVQSRRQDPATCGTYCRPYVRAS